MVEQTHRFRDADGNFIVARYQKIDGKEAAMLVIDPDQVADIMADLSAGGVAGQATAALANNLVLSILPCDLHSLSCLPAVDGYLMVFDAIAKPNDGAVTPKYVARVYGDAGRDIAWPKPLMCLAGCTAVFSTTGPLTLTAANAFLAGQVS